MDIQQGAVSPRPVGVVAQGFGWRHGGRLKPALRDIDLRIEPGERVLVLGDSGSGKSTFLAALAGVLGGGEADGEQTGQIQLTPADAPVGMVLQDPDSQVIASRVGDDVAFGCENLGMLREEIWRRVPAAVEAVGLDVALDYPTSKLSGGQKQRLALAGVVAMGAGLIVLDEPTANLDPDGARDVIAAVEHVAQRTGATLVVVEHQPAQWSHIIDRAVVLADGELVEDVRGAAEVAAVIAAREVRDLPEARGVIPGSEAAVWARELRPPWGPARSLDIPAAASTVITGANGAGKTTLLMTLAGLYRARGGELGFADVIREGLPPRPAAWTSAQLAQRIGYVFQNPEHQFVAKTVDEELAIGPRVMGLRQPEARIEELVERLRLGHLRKANPFTLSGGEKRRLSVATALVTAPRLVMLDEPTFGQDPRTFAELVRMLRELTDEGITVASVTHDPLFMAALGDHRVELRGEGRHG